MSSPTTPPHAASSRELTLIKRLFSMLDEFTQGEIILAMDDLFIQLEREAAEAARLRFRFAAIRAWRQTIRQNTGCWADLQNLAFLETHERMPPTLRADTFATAQKASKHHFRNTLEV